MGMIVRRTFIDFSTFVCALATGRLGRNTSGEGAGTITASSSTMAIGSSTRRAGPVDRAGYGARCGGATGRRGPAADGGGAARGGGLGVPEAPAGVIGRLELLLG